MKYKKFFGTIFFIVISLFIYALFPVNNSFQQIFTLLVFFLVFPLVFNKIFLKNKLDFYGFSLGNWQQGLFWSMFSLGIIYLFFFLSSYYFNFFKEYTVPIFITKSFVNFILYEFLLMALFVFIYEFYFRGFVLFIFEAKFKKWAILIQTLLFGVLVLSIGRESWYLFLPYLIFTPFAGFIALKSRSILYSGVSQFLIILILDTQVVRIIN